MRSDREKDRVSLGLFAGGRMCNLLMVFGWSGSEIPVFLAPEELWAYYHRNRTQILQKRREKRFMKFSRPETAMV